MTHSVVSAILSPIQIYQVQNNLTKSQPVPYNESSDCRWNWLIKLQNWPQTSPVMK